MADCILSELQEGCTQPQDEDIMDIPLDDPAANKAAAKIQAGFRGHMTRKKMKDDKPREEVSSMGKIHLPRVTLLKPQQKDYTKYHTKYSFTKSNILHII